eukprot:2238952-Prymnesium_polylepis.2
MPKGRQGMRPRTGQRLGKRRWAAASGWTACTRDSWAAGTGGRVAPCGALSGCALSSTASQARIKNNLAKVSSPKSPQTSDTSSSAKGAGMNEIRPRKKKSSKLRPTTPAEMKISPQKKRKIVEHVKHTRGIYVPEFGHFALLRCLWHKVCDDERSNS